MKRGEYQRVRENKNQHETLDQEMDDIQQNWARDTSACYLRCTHFEYGFLKREGGIRALHRTARLRLTAVLGATVNH